MIFEVFQIMTCILVLVDKINVFGLCGKNIFYLELIISFDLEKN